MPLTERIQKSETRQFKMIFKNTLNDHSTLFGGTAMQWMDEVAYITAMRFARMKMVTVSTEKISFKEPVRYGTIAEIIGKVVRTSALKIDILVEIYFEEIQSDKRVKAVEGIFTFVAVDENNTIIRHNIKESIALIDKEPIHN